MLRSLTRGEYDQRIRDLGISLGPPATPPVDEAAGAAPPRERAQDVQAETVPDGPRPAPGQVLPETRPMRPPQAEPVSIVEEPSLDRFRKPRPDPQKTLDDLIYAYLAGQDTP